MANLTDLQQAILVAKQETPNASNKEIAKRVGCSPSYVSATLNNHGGWELDQLDGDPMTPDEYDGEYKPPMEDKGPDWAGLTELIAIILLLLFLVGFMAKTGLF